MYLDVLLSVIQDKAIHDAIVRDDEEEDEEMEPRTKPEVSLSCDEKIRSCMPMQSENLAEISTDRLYLECIVLNSIFDYWKNSPQHVIITIEKVLHLRGLVHTQSLICYLFNHNHVRTIWSLLILNHCRCITKTISGRCSRPLWTTSWPGVCV